MTDDPPFPTNNPDHVMAFEFMSDAAREAIAIGLDKEKFIAALGLVWDDVQKDQSAQTEG